MVNSSHVTIILINIMFLVYLQPDNLLQHEYPICHVEWTNGKLLQPGHVGQVGARDWSVIDHMTHSTCLESCSESKVKEVQGSIQEVFEG